MATEAIDPSDAACFCAAISSWCLREGAGVRGDGVAGRGRPAARNAILAILLSVSSPLPRVYELRHVRALHLPKEAPAHGERGAAAGLRVGAILAAPPHAPRAAEESREVDAVD